MDFVAAIMDFQEKKFKSWKDFLLAFKRALTDLLQMIMKEVMIQNILGTQNSGFIKKTPSHQGRYMRKMLSSLRVNISPFANENLEIAFFHETINWYCNTCYIPLPNCPIRDIQNVTNQPILHSYFLTCPDDGQQRTKYYGTWVINN